MREIPEIYEAKSESIGILARGSSLAKSGYLSFLDEFIIVNRFDDELAKEPVKNILKNKKIIHMVNPREQVLSKELLKEYRVEKVVLNWFDPGLIWHVKSYIKETMLDLLQPGREEPIYQTYRHKRPKSAGLVVEYLPDAIAPYMKDISTTGLKAIVLAAIVLRKKHIYVAGIDFFESDYFVKPLTAEPDRHDERVEASSNMKQFLTDFASDHPEIQFYFITDASFQPNLPNVKIYNFQC